MKRLTHLIICTVCICVIIPFNAFAMNVASIRGAPISASPGETVTVSLEMTDNPGIAAWLFTLSWDSDVFEFVEDSFSAGNAFKSGTMLENTGQSGKLSVNWFHINNVTKNGSVFLFSLAVSEQAPSGEYKINVSYSKDNTINIDEKPVTLATSDITVTVKGDTSQGESGSSEISGQTGSSSGNQNHSDNGKSDSPKPVQNGSSVNSSADSKASESKTEPNKSNDDTSFAGKESQNTNSEMAVEVDDSKPDENTSQTENRFGNNKSKWIFIILPFVIALPAMVVLYFTKLKKVRNSNESKK